MSDYKLTEDTRFMRGIQRSCYSPDPADKLQDVEI